MPQLYNHTGFYNCCGANIIWGFNVSPDHPGDFEKEYFDDPRWGRTLRDKLDENGNKVPKNTCGDKFLDSLAGGYADHGYVCILTDDQLPAWMPVLKKAGFIFACQWNNYVHGTRPNYLFVLPKQTSKLQGIPHPLTPPKGWNDLPEENKLKLRPDLDSPSPSPKVMSRAA